MNATRFLSIDFGSDEVSPAVVRNFPSQHAPASKVAAHRFANLTTGVARTRACRAWPSASGLIYVVDSHPGLAQLAKTFLDAEGFPTCAFSDRVTAWQAFAFANSRPALLITDNLDGDAAALELIRRCRAIEPKLKTLLVDHHFPAKFPRADENFADGRLCLPYCGALLVHEVRRLCPAAARKQKN